MKNIRKRGSQAPKGARNVSPKTGRYPPLRQCRGGTAAGLNRAVEVARMVGGRLRGRKLEPPVPVGLLQARRGGRRRVLA